MNRISLVDASDADGDFEAHIEAFEEAVHTKGPEAIALFLPSDQHPEAIAISAELIRIDLERRYAAGDRASLEGYRRLAPVLFEHSESLGEVAFEEYRLRRRSGEPSDPADYAIAYGIDSSSWPNIEVAESSAIRRSDRDFPGVGERFGEFELLEVLGRGAFGVVYLARQHDLAAREVALKVTPRRSLEAQRLARLQHTNITPIYSTHLEGEWLAICMPFLGRDTLADLLIKDANRSNLSTVVDRGGETVQAQPKDRSISQQDSGGRDTGPRRFVASERETADIVAQLAEGLAHAHQRGIIHSDLKPANVLIGDDGVARLLDFNLSADTRANDPQTLLVGGTLPYLSPEHLESLESGNAVLPSSDVYSLVSLLYELLTGTLPFRRPTSTLPHNFSELIAERRAFNPSRLVAFPSVSPALKGVLAKGLSPNPIDRYASASDLAEDLRRHLADESLRHAREPLGTERLAKWRRRHARAVRILTGAALLVAVALLSWGLLGRGERLATAEARNSLEAFRDEATTATLYLHTPGDEPELWATGAGMAQLALAQFDTASQGSGKLGRLMEGEQEWVRTQSLQLRRLLNEYRRRTDPTSAASSPLGVDSTLTLRDPISLAVTRSSARDYTAVIATLEGSTVDWSGDPVGWLLLGNAQVAQGRLIEAEASYTALIALQPSAMVGPYYRGLVRYQAGRYSLAEQDFTTALGLAPEKVCLLLNRGLCRRQLGMLEDAESDISLALTQDDTNPRTWLLRADLRRTRGDDEGADEDVRQGLAREPLDDLGWSARGLALLDESGDQSLTELLKGLEAFPNSPSLLKNLVHVLADRLDRPKEAVRYADAMIEARPNDTSARLSLAVLSARQGDRQSALQHVQTLDPLKASPLDALQMACVYALTSSVEPEDKKQAMTCLQAALRGEPRLCLRAGRDADLKTLRQDPQYRKLMTAATELAVPVSSL